jgi:hypothetical protein
MVLSYIVGKTISLSTRIPTDNHSTSPSQGSQHPSGGSRMGGGSTSTGHRIEIGLGKGVDGRP